MKFLSTSLIATAFAAIAGSAIAAPGPLRARALEVNLFKRSGPVDLTKLTKHEMTLLHNHAANALRGSSQSNHETAEIAYTTSEGALKRSGAKKRWETQGDIHKLIGTYHHEKSQQHERGHGDVTADLQSAIAGLQASAHTRRKALAAQAARAKSPGH